MTGANIAEPLVLMNMQVLIRSSNIRQRVAYPLKDKSHEWEVEADILIGIWTMKSTAFALTAHPGRQSCFKTGKAIQNPLWIFAVSDMIQTLTSSPQSCMTPLREDLPALLQVIVLPEKLRTPAPGQGIFSGNLLQLLHRHLADEGGVEELQWRVWANDKPVAAALAHDIVDYALASNFVVGLEDVMEVLDSMILVAHGSRGLNQVIHAHECDTALV